jgi:hypothetical protein
VDFKIRTLDVNGERWEFVTIQWSSGNWTFPVFELSICVRKWNGPVFKLSAILIPFKNQTNLSGFWMVTTSLDHFTLKKIFVLFKTV